MDTDLPPSVSCASVNRRRFISLTLGAAGVIGFTPKLLPRKLKRFEQSSWALGTQVSLVAYHEDHATAERAVKAAFRELDELENVLSLYRPHSQICQLNRDGFLDAPHKDMLAVVRSARDWGRLTGGAFDPTVQPLWALHASGESPDPSQLEFARRLVDWRRMHVDVSSIRLGRGQKLTLNGIAPGYAADRVREIFLTHEIRHALANTGEFCGLGPKPDGQPWQMGIQHPRVREAYVALAALDGGFLATSGDYETKFSNDFSSHHIFDPATGRSPGELSSVTVIARSGIDADALSTSIFVLGAARGLELAASQADVAVFLVLKNGDVVVTPNFPRIA